MVALYCTEAQVIAQLGLVDPKQPGRRLNVGAETIPTKKEVTEIIEDVEQIIDNYCNSTWKATTITDETHSFPIDTYFQQGRWKNNGYYIQLNNRYITSITKFELWNGNSYDDIVATGIEGTGMLDGSYFVDYPKGMFWLSSNYSTFGESTIKTTYIFNQTPVPGTIRRAAILLSAVQMVESRFDYDNKTVTNEVSMDNQRKAEAWEKRAYRILESEYVHVPIPQR